MRTLSKYKRGPIYTPPVVITDNLYGTVQMPGWAGGANWWGAAIDPETAMLYVPSFSSPIVVGLNEPDAARSDWTYTAKNLVPAPTVQGLPILKPPYRRITAIDMNRGEFAWQKPIGQGPTEQIPSIGCSIKWKA